MFGTKSGDSGFRKALDRKDRKKGREGRKDEEATISSMFPAAFLRELCGQSFFGLWLEG
jgi:hypothetical protein